MTSDIGTKVPPPVRPLPVAASRSFSVVVTTIDTVGQIGVGGVAGEHVDLNGQVGEEAADNLHVSVADQTVALGGRGRGQLWRQRLTGQCAPLT